MRNQKDGVFSNVAMKLFTNCANVLLQSMQLIREKVQEKQTRGRRNRLRDQLRIFLAS